MTAEAAVFALVIAVIPSAALALVASLKAREPQRKQPRVRVPKLTLVEHKRASWASAAKQRTAK